jgi:HlyD family secretion protein
MRFTDRFVRTLAILAVLVVLSLAGWLAFHPADHLVQGEMEATTVDVAPKIPGRVDSVLVREGDHVVKGQILATLDSPEIRAKLAQANAAHDAASAVKDKAQHGAREEEIRGARELWQRAEHAADLAHKTLARVANLYKDGVVSAQKMDEAEAQDKTARDAANAAKAGYDMAVAGARVEDRTAASAVADQAAGVVSEVESYLGETRLKAPISGEVADRVVDPGELVATGYPVITLVDLEDVWLTLNLREDELAGLKVGDRLRARVPALADREFDFAVSYIAVQGDYATWRATNALGGFDLKTFEVRARPVAKIDGLRPGMSGLVKWNRRK